MVYTCCDVWPDACMVRVLRSSNNNCSQLVRIGEKKAPHRVTVRCNIRFSLVKKKKTTWISVGLVGELLGGVNTIV